MSQLAACFEKQFRGGARISAELEAQADGFSVLVLFGPSGSGKTTILRCLAGLERPEQGFVRFGEETWFDSETGTDLRPQQRSVGYLFQQYALFPHRTVQQNIAFGIQDGANEANERVAQLIRRFDLPGLEDRYPHQLSGGQQQRVALARTLACRPRLLLLDEPLSSLDQGLREEVRGQLREWLSSFAVPTIMVTHDRVDAMALGDRIAVLSEGRVLQHGAIQEVFAAPVGETVARIVGVETILEGRVVERVEGMVRLNVQGATLWAAVRQAPPDRVLACIRGEDVILSRDGQSATSVRNRLPGKIVALTPEGPLVRVSIDCGFVLTALITKPASVDLDLRLGEERHALVKATAIHVIPH